MQTCLVGPDGLQATPVYRYWERIEKNGSAIARSKGTSARGFGLMMVDEYLDANPGFSTSEMLISGLLSKSRGHMKQHRHKLNSTGRL